MTLRQSCASETGGLDMFAAYTLSPQEIGLLFSIAFLVVAVPAVAVMLGMFLVRVRDRGPMPDDSGGGI